MPKSPGLRLGFRFQRGHASGMPQPKSLSTVADFKQTLSLLLCECVATIGEFLKFEICSKADETEEGSLILNWTVRNSGISDSIRVILDDSKNGKPVATL